MSGRPVPRVLLLSGPEVTGVELYRACLPAIVAARNGYPVEWCAVGDPDRLARQQAAHLISFVRLAWPPDQLDLMQVWMTRIRSIGQRVICDFDDDVLAPEVVGHTLGTWADYDQTALAHIRQAQAALAAAVDGVTTTTDVLAQRLAPRLTCPVAVVPNSVSVTMFQRAYRGAPRTLPPPVIGWVGGDRPAADFTTMLTAWEIVARRYPQTRFVVACGQEPPGLRDAVPADRLTVRGWVAPQDSPRQWADIDIACLPLADNVFNRAKSALKAYEAGAAGAAIVASPVVYGETLRHGADALLARTRDDWVAYLGRLVTDGHLRATLARRWGAKVQRRHNLDTQWARWPAAWTRLYYGDLVRA